jgi:transcriptional regulator with XRE-family HTH domain
MNTGTKLKLLRILHDLDQAKMAKLLNVSQPVYSRYENNEKSLAPDSLIVRRIHEEFDINYEWLVDTEIDPFQFTMAGAGNSKAGEQTNNYYSVPKEFMDVFLVQQQLFEKLIKKFL